MDGHLNKAWKRTDSQNIKACDLWRDAGGSEETRTKVASWLGRRLEKSQRWWWEGRQKEIMHHRKLLLRELAIDKFWRLEPLMWTLPNDFSCVEDCLRRLEQTSKHTRGMMSIKVLALEWRHCLQCTSGHYLQHWYLVPGQRDIQKISHLGRMVAGNAICWNWDQQKEECASWGG